MIDYYHCNANFSELSRTITFIEDLDLFKRGSRLIENIKRKALISNELNVAVAQLQ